MTTMYKKYRKKCRFIKKKTQSKPLMVDKSTQTDEDKPCHWFLVNERYIDNNKSNK